MNCRVLHLLNYNSGPTCGFCNVYRCEHGVLASCYGEGDLEVYEGVLNMSTHNWESLPRISLREAAKSVQPPKCLLCIKMQLQKEMCSLMYVYEKKGTLHIKMPSRYFLYEPKR